MVEMAKGLGIVDFEVADMDLDSDGNVPFDEFVAWWRMRCMFMKFDVSGEGHLSRAEVQQLSRELGIQVCRAYHLYNTSAAAGPDSTVGCIFRCQISVRSMDVDGDDCIDFSEFSAWWHMRHKYDKFDDDKTGQLTCRLPIRPHAQIIRIIPDAESCHNPLHLCRRTGRQVGCVDRRGDRELPGHGRGWRWLC